MAPGTCRAMAVVTRKIGADLKVAPDGTYSGIYTGSKIGPAQIQGRRSGNQVVLTVHWPKPVNGDQKGSAGDFAQDADSLSIDHVQQTAWSTTAGTFTLTGMHLQLTDGSGSCF